MFQILIIFALFAWGVIEYVSWQNPNPTIDSMYSTVIPATEYSEDEAAKVKRSFAVLLKKCPSLQGRWWNFKKIESLYWPVLNPERTQLLGWKNEVMFTFTVNDISAPFNPTPKGEILFYALGGGRKPGIIVGKAHAKALCPFNDEALSNDDDRRLAVEALSFLGE